PLEAMSPGRRVTIGGIELITQPVTAPGRPGLIGKRALNNSAVSVAVHDDELVPVKVNPGAIVKSNHVGVRRVNSRSGEWPARGRRNDFLSAIVRWLAGWWRDGVLGHRIR